MKRTILILFSLYYLYALIDAQSCADPATFYYGYWGADLTETTIPNIIWDTEDVNQLTHAHNNGVRVLFYLQDLLFQKSGGWNLRANWMDLFDGAYGDENSPKNPYNILGLYGSSPNGFFLGSNLMYDSTSLNAINVTEIGNYIRSQYPTALIALDENIQLYLNDGENSHNMVIDYTLGDPFNILSISHYWPDIYPYLLQPTFISHVYKHSIQSYVTENLKMVWSIAMYETTSTYEALTCHPPSGQDCEFVMINRTIETFAQMCRDRANCGETNQYDDDHTDKIKGIWGWHWDNRPGLNGYEFGLESMPNLLAYEQYFGSLACTLIASPAPHVTLSAFVLILASLVTLL